MRTIKRTVSVLLTLMLVLGMVTIAIGTASAAGTYKINVTSNIGKSTSKDYNASTEKVTITFNIKADNLIGTRGLITYDQNVLELANTTATKIFPNLTEGLVANTTKTDGRIPFSAYSLNGFEFDTAKTYVRLTFNVKSCTKDTTVKLDILDLIGSSTIPNKDETDEINYIHNGTINNPSAFKASVAETVTPEVVDEDPFIQSETLALEGEIGMNFYLYAAPTGYTASNIKIAFSGPGTAYNKTVQLSSLSGGTRNGVAVKKYAYFVAPSDMTKTVTLKFYNGSTLVETYTTCVSDWVDKNISRFETSTPKVATLMKTMLNYGAAAQIYFDSNTGNLANKNSSYALTKINASQISVPSGLDVAPKISGCGLSFTQSTAALEAGTDLRLKCSITDATKAKTATVTCDGNTLPSSSNSTIKVFTLKSIAAPYLDTAYTFKFSNGAQYKQSIMNFCKTWLASNSSNEQVVNLVSAIYWYNQAANDYFGE